jgi:hypothetical protein
MKQAKNRFNVKRLFIFGAGASCCATSTMGDEKKAPLDKEFCGRIQTVDALKPLWVKQSKDLILKAWRDHLPFDDFGLEQAIIRHFGHTEFKRAIHKRANLNMISDGEYINHLAHLICYVLRKAREGTKAPYEKFAHNLFDSNQDRIITFNYDELLDQHLLNDHSKQELYFDRIDVSEHGQRAEKHPNPILIKLHGSVNWRCSKSALKSIVEGAQRNRVSEGVPESREFAVPSVWYAKKGTPSPEEDSSPLIIPPLPSKPITYVKLFCFLWTKAYEYLHEAEEIVICGYSLPEADQLAQSMFANFANKKLSAVTIIDPDPSIMRKWRDLLRRKSISQNARWHYYESFTEYVTSVA